MAAQVITPAQLELINSLGQDEIPIKLRCAIDSRLAVNAFRLPCCDQSICESCQSTLPTTCPVCEHSPVSAADCKPNKSLRTTIKVFLRTEEKKREASRAKEAQDSAPVTPVVEVPPTPVEESMPKSFTNEATAETEVVWETPVVSQVEESVPAADTELPVDHQKDVPQPTIEEIAPDQEPVETAGDAGATAEGNENGVIQLESQNDEAKEGSNDPGMDGGATGDFSGMNMAGDFNQMQMMMAMQNGMGAGGFGNFPMMGMPGMSMDPMMMQNMFMNGGFGVGGMGMNGMNMGMGMGGFNDGSGAGFNGWNGQQNSWNVGQDNFNPPNAAGMMMGHGDYRSNNSGYTPNPSGFNNQGNYGRSQYNDSNSYGNNYGYRGRGRGRGGLGRGGYGHQDFSQQHAQNYGQQYAGPSEISSATAETKVEAGNVDEFGRELRPSSQSGDGEKREDSESLEYAQNDAKNDINEVATNGTPENNTQSNESNGAPMPIRSLDEDNAAKMQMNGGSAQPYVAYSQPYGSRNASFGMHPPVVKPEVPINAPTGPKAMREGLPNVGYRPRQFQASIPPNTKPSESISGSVQAGSETVVDRAKSRSPSRERSREISRDRSRDRKRSRSRSRERHHRRHRHRSESLSEDEKETQRRRERRRERRLRREEEDARAESDDIDVPEDRNEEIDRSRSASPSEHKRSSHRSSRREKDKHKDSDRERERERDRDYKSSSHKHRSHRSRRDDRSKSRDRDRDKDRDHRRRHSRRASLEVPERERVEKSPLPPTPVEASAPASRKQSIASNNFNGIEIRGVSSRRKPLAPEAPSIPTGPRSDRVRNRDSEMERSGGSRSNQDSSHHRDSETRSSRDNRDRNHERRSSYFEKDKDKAPSSTAESKAAVVDPHTLEREARNRERLLKEAQRIAGLTGGFGRKRSRDDGVEGKSGGGSRKKGRRGGVVGEEDEEARMNRLEAERESARWA